MVVEMMVLAGEFNIGYFIPALDWLDLQGITKKMKKLHARFDSFLNAILEEHKTGNGGASGHVDLLSTLISLREDADGEDGKLSDIEIKALLLLQGVVVEGTRRRKTTYHLRSPFSLISVTICEHLLFWNQSTRTPTMSISRPSPTMTA